MKGKLYIIKIGGNIIDREADLDNFLDQFAGIKEYKILVHGGGKLATEMAERLGIKQTIVEGRRVTDEQTLRIAVMVYAGWINKTITARLQARNCNAIGLSGADLSLIRANKRSHPEVDFGFVGDIKPGGVNVNSSEHLLKSGFAPVFCAITHDGNGQLFNTNADTMASELAAAFADRFDVSLIYCFEKSGVLADANDDKSVISNLSYSLYESLKIKEAVSKGMIPKLDNAFNASRKNVQRVIIGHASELTRIINKKENVATSIIG